MLFALALTSSAGFSFGAFPECSFARRQADECPSITMCTADEDKALPSDGLSDLFASLYASCGSTPAPALHLVRCVLLCCCVNYH